MKTKILFLAAGVSLFAACKNETTTDNNGDGKTTVVTVNMDSVEGRYNDFYSNLEKDSNNWYGEDTAYWTRTNQEYETMNRDIDTRYGANMSEENKQRLEKARNRYTEMRTRAENEMKMRTDLLQGAAEKPGNAFQGVNAEPSLSKVTGANMLQYYRDLVATVRRNKNTYTPAQWDAIKSYYEKLDAKKNEFEGKTLSAADNLKIAKLKIIYDGIRVPQRTDAKIEEKIKEDKNK